MIDRTQLNQIILAWILSAVLVGGAMAALGRELGYEQGYERGVEDGTRLITEICIKEEEVSPGTPYIRYGSTTAVFIEDEQGTHVVKMCE